MKSDLLLWQQALTMLMRRTRRRDPAQWKLYFSMYWGAEHLIHPRGFLRRAVR